MERHLRNCEATLKHRPQDNYENYRHHDTYVANGQVNVQYLSLLVKTYKSNLKQKTVGMERNNVER